MSAFGFFKTIFTIMLFYSVAITIFVHSLPESERNFIVSYDFGTNTSVNYTELGNRVSENIERHTQVGLADAGALVLFSGNLLLDLLLNTFTAIPSMISVFFKIIFMLFPVDAMVARDMLLGVYAFSSILISLSMIYFLTQVRTQNLGWA